MMFGYPCAVGLLLASWVVCAVAEPVAAQWPKMVEIPSGCFQMGSPAHETERRDNESQHRVCVSHFKIASHETTVAQFRQFVEATHYQSDAEQDYELAGCWSYDNSQQPPWGWWPWANWKTPFKNSPSRDDEPVVCVSWQDVNHYLDWLNQTSGHHFRLPTEAEWEYAARAGDNHSHYWGNNPSIACRYANTADVAAVSEFKSQDNHDCLDHVLFAAPVKQFLPNRFGLYDMLGNVWEWTCSRYQPDYNGEELRCLAPDQAGAEVFIAVRGGGWNADTQRARVAYRNFDDAWARLSSWGFRLVQVD